MLFMCFNPYSTGFGSLRYFFSASAFSTAMFQSLFYWIWLSKDASDNGDIRYNTSFNPYSTGFGSLSKPPATIVFTNEEFQSLFYWIWLSKLWMLTAYIYFIPVSILILLDLAL